ncbi:CGNR zinc finger domain-containing protein [Kribbella sp. NPDC020789]
MTEPLPQAPGADEHLALDFVGTAIALPGNQYVDLLGSPEETGRWLADRKLADQGTKVEEMCASQLRALREHLRSLFAARVDGLPALPAAVSAVNDALTRVPTAALLRWDARSGPYREAVCPPNLTLDRALATIAASAADLLTSPAADALALCSSPPCNRYFLRQGRRQWCSTRCGDRVRAARAYARRSQTG